MNTQTTQRFVSNSASTRDSARRGSTYRSSTQRFVSNFAAIRIVTRRSSLWRSTSLRNSSQLNDLLVTTTTRLVATRRFSTCRIVSQRPLNSTQQFVSNVAPFRSASPRNATQCTSSQLNDLLVTPLRSATIRSASPRNATQRFVSDNSALGNATLCAATQLNSTQRFVSDTAPLLSASYRFASLRISPQLNVIA